MAIQVRTKEGVANKRVGDLNITVSGEWKTVPKLTVDLNRLIQLNEVESRNTKGTKEEPEPADSSVNSGVKGK